MPTLIERLQSAAMEARGATAIAGDEPMTFSELWSRTDAFAGGLRERDVTADDVVGIRVSDQRAFLIAFFGALRNGSIPVTMPLEYDDRAVVSALNETNGAVLVTDQRRVPSMLTRADDLRVAVTVGTDVPIGIDLSAFLDNSGINNSGTRSGMDVIRRSDDDRGLIAYVGSGAAGTDSRAVTYTRGALAAAANAGASIGGTSGDNPPAGNGGNDAANGDGGRTLLGAVPLSNPLALLYGASATILEGNCYRPLATWEAETARSLRHTVAPERTLLTPQQYAELRALGIDDADDVVVLDSTPVADDATGSATRLYGVPETGVTHRRSAADVRTGRIGEPLAGVETTVLADETGDGRGELAISSPAVMDGYFERPDRTADTVETVDGTRWVRTGARVTREDETIVLEDAPSAASRTENA